MSVAQASGKNCCEEVNERFDKHEASQGQDEREGLMSSCERTQSIGPVNTPFSTISAPFRWTHHYIDIPAQGASFDTFPNRPEMQ